MGVLSQALRRTEFTHLRGAIIRDTHRVRNQRTKSITSTDMAERNAAATIACDVNGLVMLRHVNRTMVTCRYEASVDTRIDSFSWKVVYGHHRGEITLHCTLMLDEIVA